MRQDLWYIIYNEYYNTLTCAQYKTLNPLVKIFISQPHTLSNVPVLWTYNSVVVCHHVTIFATHFVVATLSFFFCHTLCDCHPITIFTTNCGCHPITILATLLVRYCKHNQVSVVVATMTLLFWPHSVSYYEHFLQLCTKNFKNKIVNYWYVPLSFLDIFVIPQSKR